MFGGSVTWMRTPDRDVELVGAHLEIVSWHGRFGIAGEGSLWQGLVDGGPRAVAAGGSARLQIADWLTPSLLEPRDVEIGLELHAVAERLWWSANDTADRWGLGLAIRMRGGGDENESPLLAESRLYVRVLKTRGNAPSGTTGAIAHATTDPTMEHAPTEGYAVIICLGAAFGTGKPRYVERFRLRHTFDWGRPELSPKYVR